MFKAIYHLLFGKRFEFDTTYTIDEIYKNIRTLSNSDKQKKSIRDRLLGDLLISFEEMDNGIHRFKYRQIIIGDYDIIAKGQIDQEGNIEGAVKLGILLKLAPIMFLLLYFVASLLIPPTQLMNLQLLFICVFLIFGIIFLWAWYELKQLYQFIHNTLGKSKKKNPGGEV